MPAGVLLPQPECRGSAAAGAAGLRLSSDDGRVKGQDAQAGSKGCHWQPECMDRGFRGLRLPVTVADAGFKLMLERSLAETEA